ncbi:MAG: MGMT family protein [Gemmatimonadaceae bacterium]
MNTFIKCRRDVKNRNDRGTTASGDVRQATMVACAYFMVTMKPVKNGDADATPPSLHERIRAVISKIPRGRVATYGQIARLAGLPGQARLVGYALHALAAGSSLPWQRVVNAQGGISTPDGPSGRQRRLLKKEGIRFDVRGRIPLATFQWRPRSKPKINPHSISFADPFSRRR